MGIGLLGFIKILKHSNMNFLPIFETRTANNSGKLMNLKKLTRTKFIETGNQKLNQLDSNCMKGNVSVQAKPPSGLKHRRYSLGKNSKRISICDRSRRSDSSQDSIKENLILIQKYELPNKIPALATRRKTQITLTKAFVMTQTDLSDEDI